MTLPGEDFCQRIAAHPFLRGLNPAQIEILADCAQPRQVDANEILFRAGDPARGFYLIERGSIAVESADGGRPPVTIDVVTPGEPLGWSWIFAPFVCEYGARALEPTTAIFFDALRLADHRGADLTLGHELFKRMSQVMVRRLSRARANLVHATHRAEGHA